MAIYTEADPRSPGPVRHPGAFLPGAYPGDRGAEYGAPAAGSGVIFGPGRHPGHATGAGDGEGAPTLGDVVGHTPAIGEIRR